MKYVRNRLINYYYAHRALLRNGLRILHPAMFVLGKVPLFEPWAHLYAVARKPDEATGEGGEVFGEIEGKLGREPNIRKARGVAPATVKAYVGISGAMCTASIPARVRERIALRVAGWGNPRATSSRWSTPWSTSRIPAAAMRCNT